jgi:hypothetical protein
MPNMYGGSPKNVYAQYLFYNYIYQYEAPAGGAAAAAPEGGALASPSASPHFPVVGAGNPVAVPSMARQGANKRADSSIRMINRCREGHVQIEGF